jgi:hypothetical protein
LLRLGDPATEHECFGQVEISLGVLWLQLNGTLQIGYALFGTAQGEKDAPPRIVIKGLIRVDAHRLFHQPQGLVMLALLVAYDAQQVQGVSMLRLDLEDFCVNLLRFGYGPGAMFGDGPLQGIRDGYHLCRLIHVNRSPKRQTGG